MATGSAMGDDPERIEPSIIAVLMRCSDGYL
jgi:hypothetical protein